MQRFTAIALCAALLLPELAEARSRRRQSQGSNPESEEINFGKHFDQEVKEERKVKLQEEARQRREEAKEQKKKAKSKSKKKKDTSDE